MLDLNLVLEECKEKVPAFPMSNIKLTKNRRPDNRFSYQYSCSLVCSKPKVDPIVSSNKHTKFGTVRCRPCARVVFALSRLGVKHTCSNLLDQQLRTLEPFGITGIKGITGISGTLQEHCRNIAGILQAHCRNIAGSLQEHCRNIAGSLQTHCRLAAIIEQHSPLVQLRLSITGTIPTTHASMSPYPSNTLYKKSVNY